jgi:tripartite-type tricarboxylate transporter receptor subunit TctC
VQEPDLIRQLAVVGVEPASAGPQDFAAVLLAETRRIAETVRAAGIKAK